MDAPIAEGEGRNGKLSSSDRQDVEGSGVYYSFDSVFETERDGKENGGGRKLGSTTTTTIMLELYRHQQHPSTISNFESPAPIL